MDEKKASLVVDHMPLSSPPLPPKVVTTLAELGITTRAHLLNTGIIPAFLLLKASGMTVTRSVLWQLWAVSCRRPVHELTEAQKKELTEQ